MNIFELHSRIIGQYEQYVESFLEIADDEINTFAHQQLIDETVFWPDPLIQLNPSYNDGRQLAAWSLFMNNGDGARRRWC